MKIGILTYHRSHNYGACLQAIATRLVLEDMGHHAFYIDYWPDYHRRYYSIFSWSRFSELGLIGKVFYLYNTFRTYPYVKKRQKAFSNFLDMFIVPFCKQVSEQYDVVLYGSDQIWRKQISINDYNPVYFACNDISASKHVSFSASMGILPQNEKERDKVKDLVHHFDRISVREADLKDLLCNLGYINVIQTIDPTLLIDSSDWDATFNLKCHQGDKYLLVYALHPEAFNMNHIREFAKHRNLRVKVLLGKATHRDTEDEIAIADPRDFVQLIKDAQCVISSSYHGLVFSILYQKEVFASFKDNSNRASTLLNSLGIEERLLPAGSKIPVDLRPIDYNVVNEKLCVLRKDTLSFLRSL